MLGCRHSKDSFIFLDHGICLFKYWCSIQVNDLGTSIFSVESVSNLIWDDAESGMSDDFRSKKCSMWQSVHKFWNIKPSTVNVFSCHLCLPSGFTQQELPAHQETWKFRMRIRSLHCKIRLVDHWFSILFSNSVAVIAWAVFAWFDRWLSTIENHPTPQSQAPSQALTLLYIGGASSTSSLLSCQEVDGAGETWHATILPPERRSGEMQWGSMSHRQVEVPMNGSPWCGWKVRQIWSISVASSFCRTSCQLDYNAQLCNLRTVFHGNSLSARRCPISYVTKSLRQIQIKPLNSDVYLLHNAALPLFLYCSLSFCCAYKESKLKHSVDTLAFSGAFFYGIIIPCCLLYLYGRQHVLFQSNRTTVAIVADHGSLKVSLYKVLDSTVQKTGNVEFTRRLVAAAAASISVLSERCLGCI